MQEKYNNSGFTLIELVITTSIILILMSVFLANFSGNSVSRNLNISRNELVSNLRKAQSDSLASRDIAQGDPAIDYGLSFDFLNNPTTYNFIGDDNSPVPVRTVFSTSTLSGNTYFKSANITRADATMTTLIALDLLFKNPFARIQQTFQGNFADGTNDPNDITTITIGSRDSASATVTVTINGITGSIY